MSAGAVLWAADAVVAMEAIARVAVTLGIPSAFLSFMFLSDKSGDPHTRATCLLVLKLSLWAIGLAAATFVLLPNPDTLIAIAKAEGAL